VKRGNGENRTCSDRPVRGSYFPSLDTEQNNTENIQTFSDLKNAGMKKKKKEKERKSKECKKVK
jgi:hypothetical protein